LYLPFLYYFLSFTLPPKTPRGFTDRPFFSVGSGFAAEQKRPHFSVGSGFAAAQKRPHFSVGSGFAAAQKKGRTSQRSLPMKY
jgi:hypothetical protein